jgi:hypothetical protein
VNRRNQRHGRILACFTHMPKRTTDQISDSSSLGTIDFSLWDSGICGVCLSDLITPTADGYPESNCQHRLVAWLKGCCHLFHFLCIQKWAVEGETKCPLCKQSFSEVNIYQCSQDNKNVIEQESIKFKRKKQVISLNV